jgi:hypothetical protein
VVKGSLEEEPKILKRKEKKFFSEQNKNKINKNQGHLSTSFFTSFSGVVNV